MDIGQWLLNRVQSKPFNGRMIRGCEAQADADDIYMVRHFLYRSKMFNIYLHHFLRSDTDRALHDHPWNFVTVILSTGYWEHEPSICAPWPETKRTWRPIGSILYRRATHRHFVELARTGKDASGKWLDANYTDWPEVEAVTLCIVGKKWREWGFFEPDGWINWRKAFERWGCKP